MKLPSSLRLRVAFPLAVATAFYASTAPAQEADPASQPTSQPEQVTTLPAVEVTEKRVINRYAASDANTASKTDTPLIETPMSISVVTREQLTDQGAFNLQDALNYTAGVRSDEYGQDSRSDNVNVRGTEPDQYVDGLRQTYGYYTATARVEPYTLERIEVLRGPAAMLYGQGTIGGVVNMVSKLPQENFQAEVGLLYGSHDRKQIQADVTGPISDDGHWMYRVIGVGRDADTQTDYVKDDRLLLAPSLTWKPDAATTITLQTQWLKDKSGSTNQFLPWSGTISPNPNGRIPSSRYIGEPGYDHYDTDRQSIGWLIDHRFDDNWSFSQNFRYAHNKVDYLQLYGDAFSDPGQFSLDPVNQRILGRYNDWTITTVDMLNLDSHLLGKFQQGALQHTLLMGLDGSRYGQKSQSALDYDSIDVYAPVYGNHPALTLADDPRAIQSQVGLYVHDQMKYDQHWIVVAGLRYDRATNKAEGSEIVKDSALTKRLGLMYAFSNGFSPYLSYSESFTPVSGLDGNSKPYKPLRGEQIEAGLKFESLDGATHANAAIYRLEEKNELTADPTDPTTSIQVGRITNRGAELDAATTIARRLDLIAHYNYIDIDKQVTRMPRHQAGAWAKWRFDIADISGFAVGAGVRYASAFKDGVAPTTPAATLADALLSYDSQHWRYAINANNLFDREYVAIALARGDSWYGARRNVVASVAYRF